MDDSFSKNNNNNKNHLKSPFIFFIFVFSWSPPFSLQLPAMFLCQKSVHLLFWGGLEIGNSSAISNVESWVMIVARLTIGRRDESSFTT